MSGCAAPVQEPSFRIILGNNSGHIATGAISFSWNDDDGVHNESNNFTAEIDGLLTIYEGARGQVPPIRLSLTVVTDTGLSKNQTWDLRAKFPGPWAVAAVIYDNHIALSADKVTP